MQDDKTKKFLEQVEYLVNNGIEPTYKAIADKIGWHNNSLSTALKGKRNVPFEVYKKFTEVYKLEEVEKEKTASDETAYQNKYIALLEERLNQQTEILAELKEIKESLSKLASGSGQLHGISKEETFDIVSSATLGKKPPYEDLRQTQQGSPKK